MRTRALSTLFAYLAALLVVGITVVPLLFVVIGGFRTNAQINADPAGLPQPVGARQLPGHPGERRVLGVPAQQPADRRRRHRAGRGARLDGRIRAVPLQVPRPRGVLRPVHHRSAVPARRRERCRCTCCCATSTCWRTRSGWRFPRRRSRCRSRSSSCGRSCGRSRDEIEDAAVLDGATRLGFFWRILLPLSHARADHRVGAGVRDELERVPVAAAGVQRDQSNFTLPLGVATFQSQYSQDTARVLAFTALSMVPALGFFVLAERRHRRRRSPARSRDETFHCVARISGAQPGVDGRRARRRLSAGTSRPIVVT